MGHGQGSPSQPASQPASQPFRGGGVCNPPPTVTYKHLIEKPLLVAVWRKDAVPFFLLYLLSPLPQNDSLAMLMKCITLHYSPKEDELEDSLSTEASLSSIKTSPAAPSAGGLLGLLGMDTLVSAWGMKLRTLLI